VTTTHQLTSGGWVQLPGAVSTARMMVGAASSHSPLTPIQSWDALAAQVGPMVIRRSYDTDIPATWAASQGSPDTGVRASVWSCHPDMTAWLSGSLDAAWNAFLASIPDDGYPKFIIGWHEPDVKVLRGDYTSAQWRTAMAHMSTLIRAAGKPNVYVAGCVSNAPWLPLGINGGLHPDDFWIEDCFDVYSIDGYDTAAGSMWYAAMSWFRGHNIPWAVSETGYLDHDPAAKALWLTETAAWCAMQASGGWPSAVWMCWFDSDVGSQGDPTPGSTPAEISAANKICQRYHYDPTSYGS
jgi:hypothetical protein